MLVNRLPQIMKQKGLSIRRLARLTGITYSTIWAMYHGQRRSIQFEVLEAVCEVLQIQPGDIYQRQSTRKGSRPRDPSTGIQPAEDEIRPGDPTNAPHSLDQEKGASPSRDQDLDYNWRAW